MSRETRRSRLADAPTPSRQRTDSEAGFSLPEVLVTIVIVGIAFTALLGGMITSITVSDLHRKQATADTVVRDAAEWVKDLEQTYKSCAVPTGANSYSLPPAPSGYAVSVTSVEYWDGNVATSDPLTFVSSCPSPDWGLQRITLVASSSDGRASETVQILKRAK